MTASAEPQVTLLAWTHFDADASYAPTPEDTARRFHEAYERLAPDFGYETRKASAKPWAEVPERNRSLMIAVCAEILPALLSCARAEGVEAAAQAIYAAASDPGQNLQWMYPTEAVRLARSALDDIGSAA